MDILFGDSGEAGRLRKAIHFLRYSRRASVRIGKPINLRDLIVAQPTWSDERIARKIGRMMLVNLGREAMTIHGPPLKSPEHIQFEIMERRSFTRELERYQSQTDASPEETRQQARRYLREIASKPKYAVQSLIAYFLDSLFFRVFNGVEVDQAGLRRVKDAAKDSRDAPLILIPSHKSHIDYLVVSWVFLRHEFIVPHIAAGANLSFFPLGTVLRHAGAFFLRRSFVGFDLYKIVFKHYVWKLIREGYPVEFFIEGGRTRTGKLLSPKMGLLSIILEGVRRGEYKDLQFIPINLSYERVVETASYRKELTGGEKESESVRGVLNASKVFRSRYGRIYVDFESPIRLSDYLDQREISSIPQDPDGFKVATERLAYHIMHRIQEVTVIAPSSLVGLVLLSHERRGLPAERLKRLVGFVTTLAILRKARLSASITSALKRNEARILRRAREGLSETFIARGEALTFLIDESLTLLKKLIDKVERSGQVIYVVPEKQRIELDYYRNSILGLFAPEAIICTVIASQHGGISWGELLTKARWLSELLKLEFIYRNDAPFEKIVTDLLSHLKAVGVVIEERGLLHVGLQDEAMLLCSSLRHLLECYWVAAHTLKSTFEAPIEGKAWVKSTGEQADLAALQGEIRRAEAASSVSLANALQWFVRQGWVRSESHTEGRKRYKTYQVMDPEAFESFFNTLAQTLSDLPDGPPPRLSPLKHLEDQKLAHDQLEDEDSSRDDAQQATHEDIDQEEIDPTLDAQSTLDTSEPSEDHHPQSNQTLVPEREASIDPVSDHDLEDHEVKESGESSNGRA
jgi:glycerol-3-phosphate O-acyltransferase